MAHPDPHERARKILTTYLRIGIEAGGYKWGARNDRHVNELIDCFVTLAVQGEDEGDFAAELDAPAPAPHATRATTFVGKRKQSDKEVIKEAWQHVQRGDAA